MANLAGKTLFITGASRGIGKQLAVELGGRGANIVVAARTVEPHRRLTGTIGEKDGVKSINVKSIKLITPPAPRVP